MSMYYCSREYISEIEFCLMFVAKSIFILLFFTFSVETGIVWDKFNTFLSLGMSVSMEVLED